MSNKKDNYIVMCERNDVEETIYVHYASVNFTYQSRFTLSEIYTLPYEYGGRKITVIAENGFKECKFLEEMTLPYTLIKIGANAFNGCTNLKRIHLNEKLTTIGEFAFCDCVSLEEIIIPSTVTEIEYSTFIDCTNLKTIHLNKGLTTIGDRALCRCTNLEEITLPPTLTKIESKAFFGCSNLKTIHINEGLTTIGNYAFAICRNLEEITLPSTLTEIGANAFNGCSNLKKIHLNLNDELITIGESAFFQCQHLEEITLPSTLTEIGANAFNGCTNLKKIHLNEGLTTIGEYAFFQCRNLEEITIPSTVTTFSVKMFDGCSNLSKAFLLNSNLHFCADRCFENIDLTDCNINIFKNFGVNSKDFYVHGLSKLKIYEKHSHLLIQILNRFDSLETEEQLQIMYFLEKNVPFILLIHQKDCQNIFYILIENNVKLTLSFIDEVLEYSIANEHIKITAMMFEYRNNNFTQDEISLYNENKELQELGFED